MIPDMPMIPDYIRVWIGSGIFIGVIIFLIWHGYFEDWRM